MSEEFKSQETTFTFSDGNYTTFQMPNRNWNIISSPKPKVIWIWHVFGKSDPVLMRVELRFPVPFWRRMLTRIFLGSVWEKP